MLRMLFAPLCLFLVLVGGPAAAADAPPAQGPDVVLRTAVEKLQDLIKQNYKAYRADPAKFYQMVDEVVVPRFDTLYITRLVLGLNYRTATADQRKRFTAAFKDMLVRSYASAMLDNYDSVKIDWAPVRMAPGATDATVNTTLTRTNGKPFQIGFRVHQVGGDWLIYDINVENLSLVTNFRTQLNAEIKRSGIDAVIAKMESGEFNHPSGGGS